MTHGAQAIAETALLAVIIDGNTEILLGGRIPMGRWLGRGVTTLPIGTTITDTGIIIALMDLTIVQHGVERHGMAMVMPMAVRMIVVGRIEPIVIRATRSIGVVVHRGTGGKPIHGGK